MIAEQNSDSVGFLKPNSVDEMHNQFTTEGEVVNLFGREKDASENIFSVDNVQIVIQPRSIDDLIACETEYYSPNEELYNNFRQTIRVESDNVIKAYHQTKRKKSVEFSSIEWRISYFLAKTNGSIAILLYLLENEESKIQNVEKAVSLSLFEVFEMLTSMISLELIYVTNNNSFIKLTTRGRKYANKISSTLT